MAMIEAARATSTMREPRQERSKASHERMLVAAEEILATGDLDALTLAAVSRRGKVSIGSIYCRFDGKDALLHAVQLRVLDRVDARMLAQIAIAREEARSLGAIVPSLVEVMAETLRAYSAWLRPLMQRATFDPVVARTGKAYAATAAPFGLRCWPTGAKSASPIRRARSIWPIAFSMPPLPAILASDPPRRLPGKAIGSCSSRICRA
jgi:AcrR family transcriptional regulator